MTKRSWLFVPGDSEAKLAKVAGSGADAVIIDLEDAVAPEAKIMARELARDWLQAHRTQIVESRSHARWVRINALGTPWWREDLVSVMQTAPEGIVLPKSAGPEHLQTLSAELYELEQRNGIPANSTRILPLVSETAAAALTIPSYLEASLPRLNGLTWGAEDLSAALGASRKRDDAGNWTDAFRMVRANVLLTAHARGIMAIDTLHDDFKVTDALKTIARASRADGFNGMLAIHPSQVPIINEAFTASAEDLAEARAIVETFAASPGEGVVSFHGRMVDQPHLIQAKRLLGIDA
jgi:citrate lyase subunit beta/citryl-CoA lyase